MTSDVKTERCVCLQGEAGARGFLGPPGVEGSEVSVV